MEKNPSFILSALLFISFSSCMQVYQGSCRGFLNCDGHCKSIGYRLGEACDPVEPGSSIINCYCHEYPWL
ncbi:hypothetical protein DCAR_0415098 [Daucus carota subsp. sativus]|uniref:Defensin-like protein n=1 Tax=Daucus carota subsp. sativus TaxID=79200 RepID=A0AAF0WVP4_DAUCS|nr:hypothetical protein DCAR_0415098 [Daucus carota subsp. sativus]